MTANKPLRYVFVMLFFSHSAWQQIDLYSAAAAVLHDITDVTGLSTGSDERHYVVMIQLLQLHITPHTGRIII